METEIAERRQWVPLDVLRLSLEEMYKGCEKLVEVVSSTSCTQCQNERDTNCSVCGFKLLNVVFPKGTNEGFSNYLCKNSEDSVTVEVVQHQHDHYKRHNNHLFAYVAISFKEAVSGFKKQLPTLDGRTFLIQTKEGKQVSDQEILVVRNKGMPSGDSFGNLYVKFSVKIPEKAVIEKKSETLQKEYVSITSNEIGTEIF